WTLAWPIWWMFSSAWSWVGPAPEWFGKINPFVLVFAPVMLPGTVDLGDDLRFLGGALMVSTALAGVSVARVRAVAARSAGRAARARREPGRLGVSWTRWLPGPSLDGNPVLWREWHRRRPSRWSRVVWGLFAALTALFSAISIVETFQRGSGRS